MMVDPSKANSFKKNMCSQFWHLRTFAHNFHVFLALNSKSTWTFGEIIIIVIIMIIIVIIIITI